MFFDRHTVRRLFLMVGLLAALGLAMPTVAGAQEDPYGGTSTSTTQPGDDPVCTLDETEVQVGASASGTVAGLEVGAEVEIRFDGDVVDQVVADDSGSALFSFPVPDVAAGTYEVVAVGATFSVICGGEALTVLAAGAGGGDRPGGQDGGSSLARTGADLAPLIALAAALIALGVYLRRRSRHSRLAF